METLANIVTIISGIIMIIGTVIAALRYVGINLLSFVKGIALIAAGAVGTLVGLALVFAFVAIPNNGDSHSSGSAQVQGHEPTAHSGKEAYGQTEQPRRRVEDRVRAAAEAYYWAAAERDWGYTYSHLDSQTQSGFTRDEWFAKNDWLADNGSATYTIQSIGMDESSQEPIANVTVLLTFGDGSTRVRNTYFVYEDGTWKHRFSQEEYDLLMPDLSYEEFVQAQQ